MTTKTKTTHTPLPKKFYGQCSQRGFEPDAPANERGHALIDHSCDTLCLNCWCESVPLSAEFVVRAVNCHDDLLEALKAALDGLEFLASEEMAYTKRQARAAIAKAESLLSPGIQR